MEAKAGLDIPRNGIVPHLETYFSWLFCISIDEEQRKEF